MILFIIASLLFIVYLTTTIFIFGIPKSISDTYYLWKGRKCSVVFPIVILISGLGMMIPWINNSPDIIQFLPFLSCGGMLFVGTAAAFKEKLTHTVHFIGAYIWAGCALIWFMIMNYWLYIGIGLICGLIGFSVQRFKNKIFWLEISVVITILVGLTKFLW